MPTQIPSRPISPLIAPYLTAAEINSLRDVESTDLSGEIELLHVLASQVLQFQRSAPKDLHTRQQTLGTCFTLSAQLAKLIHVRSEEPEDRIVLVMDI